ncbi:hypothetical protein FRX31_023313 [Thalictrum thalictroides]|uniref:FBD domain-containing protein n=1 Tax=Thalictrum thalictroides TaxID=46969 RepID=A0A7J6VSE2_THATH|nr:hypothetical protein FRX31_023313 [Thalictrum thalictroides]
MDASVSMTNNKKQKLFEEQKIIPSEDRISSLPDEILHYILSFLGCTPGKPQCCNVTARQLVDLLCHLPTVSSFCFDNGYKGSFLKDDEDDHTLEAIPQSVLPHLKSVELGFFHGSKNELHLAQVLLNSAKALEKMGIIFSTFSAGPREQLESIKQSLMLPRDSKCGGIEFS